MFAALQAIACQKRVIAGCCGHWPKDGVSGVSRDTGRQGGLQGLGAGGCAKEVLGTNGYDLWTDESSGRW